MSSRDSSSKDNPASIRDRTPERRETRRRGGVRKGMGEATRFAGKGRRDV
ncbi:MAG TPA: hypothetical protein DCS11_02355 [Syntrophus sp. (in: bacteria)]|nr:hypothetical protein [Syntrophus sp. (in: bacteria)]